MERLNLDDVDGLRRRDPAGALDAVASLPEQIEAGTQQAVLPALLPAGTDKAIVCGMGGSGIVGDLAVELANLQGEHPVFSLHSYAVPSWCDERTVFIATSYSGGTDEVITAARTAAAMGATVVAVASGGELHAEALRSRWKVFLSPPAGSLPRYAVGHLAVSTLYPLTHGFIPAVDWAPVSQNLRGRLREWGPENPEAGNVAKQVARAVEGTLPVVWAGPGIAGVAAGRWRSDLNENAKILAHSSVLPELDHNEIVGLGPDGSDGRPAVPVSLVCLREPDEDPRITRRFEATVAEVRDSVAQVVDVHAAGPGPVGLFFDMAMLSGYVSVYLALMRGVDPVSIASIDRLKRILAGS